MTQLAKTGERIQQYYVFSPLWVVFDVGRLVVLITWTRRYSTSEDFKKGSKTPERKNIDCFQGAGFPAGFSPEAGFSPRRTQGQDK